MFTVTRIGLWKIVVSHMIQCLWPIYLWFEEKTSWFFVWLSPLIFMSLCLLVLVACYLWYLQNWSSWFFYRTGLCSQSIQRWASWFLKTKIKNTAFSTVSARNKSTRRMSCKIKVLQHKSSKLGLQYNCRIQSQLQTLWNKLNIHYKIIMNSTLFTCHSWITT
jgi:hypothetical protein